MASDLEMALAFVAKRQARRGMTGQRWAHMLSLEMGWMNPGQARSFIARAERSGLLAQDGEELRFVLDPHSVEIPRGFKPDPEAAGVVRAEAEPDLFLVWVAKVAAATSQTREQVLGRVATLQQKMGGLLTAEAAVLWLARDAGLDIVAAAQQAEKGLLTARTST